MGSYGIILIYMDITRIKWLLEAKKAKKIARKIISNSGAIS